MKKIVFLLFIAVPIMAICQKRQQFIPIQENNYLGFHFDDDFLFMGNRDEQYSGGLDFEYLWRFDTKKDKRGLFNPWSNGQRFGTATFGGALYTPYNVSDSLIILNDRPYSSYIYASFGYNAYDKYLRRRFSAEVYLGVMGSPLPGKIQSQLHTVGDSPPAFGWQHRIARKETFIPNLKLSYQKNMLTVGRLKLFHIRWIQLTNLYELNTGLFLNNLSYGIKLSAYNYEPEAGSIAYFDVGSRSFRYKTNYGSKTPKLRVNTYFLPRFEFVAHNTTLQSHKWLDSPYIITNDLINRAVWTLEVGINILYKRFHISYIVKARSKEFVKYQQDWHTWAGLTAGWSF